MRSAANPPRGSALELEPTSDPGGPRLTVRSATAADARDLVDAGADLVLADDQALAVYAAARPGLEAFPLAWDRTWVMLTPRRVSGGDLAAGPGDVAARTAAFREALARDAVRADARVTTGPHWWDDLRGCGGATATERGAPSARARPRVVYARDEPTARAIAERVVAVAARSRGPDTALALLAPAVAAVAAAGGQLTAVALSPDDFSAALRAGSELAYVVALPRRPLAPCLDAALLLSAAPWVAAAGNSIDLSSSIVPLVDTRLLAVVRRGPLGLILAADSTVTVAPRTPAPGGRPR